MLARPRSRVALQILLFYHPNNPVFKLFTDVLLVSFQDVVQSLIAELLNSNSWKDRVTACKVIPKLKGGANKVSLMTCFFFPEALEIHHKSPFIPSPAVGNKKLKSHVYGTWVFRGLKVGSDFILVVDDVVFNPCYWVPLEFRVGSLWIPSQKVGSLY